MDINNIKNIKQYIDIIDEIRSEESNQHYFYRGQSNKDWKLIPSAIRELGNSELEAYKEAKRMFPEMFRNCKNEVEEIIQMQHYGLPTMLLDLTENPLVALYFACQGEKEHDGVVFYRADNDIDNRYAEYNIKVRFCINSGERTTITYNQIKDFLKIEDTYAKEVMNPHVLYPSIKNERIRNQSGVFLIYGLKKGNNVVENKYYDDDEFYLYTKSDFYDDTVEVPMKELAVISKDNKESILKELDMFGINESTIYPDAEHQMKYVTQRIKWWEESDSMFDSEN